MALLVGFALQSQRASEVKQAYTVRLREMALQAHWQECIPCSKFLRGQFVDERGVPHFEGCSSHSGRDWSRR